MVLLLITSLTCFALTKERVWISEWKKLHKGLSQGQGKLGFLTVYWAIFSAHSFFSLLNLTHFLVSNYHLLQTTPKINLSTDLSELQTHKYNYLLDIAKWRYLKIPQIHSLHSPSQVCFSFCVLCVGEWHHRLPSYTSQTPRNHPWHDIILIPSSLFIHFLPKVYLKHITSVLWG